MFDCEVAYPLSEPVWVVSLSTELNVLVAVVKVEAVVVAVAGAVARRKHE